MVDGFRVESPDIARFAKQLRAVDDKKVRGLAMKRIKGLAAQGIADAQAGAWSIPANGSNGLSHTRSTTGTRVDQKGRTHATSTTTHKLGPLRPILASSIKAVFRSGGRQVGLSIRVSRAVLKNRAGAEKILEYGGRHMTFGHEPWVEQASWPWFFEALEPWREKGHRELSKVIDDISRELGFR